MCVVQSKDVFICEFSVQVILKPFGAFLVEHIPARQSGQEATQWDCDIFWMLNICCNRPS
ncbi:hypothetical protein AAC03nite_36950 [Alicyclobacillus acidoterrestris]|nr:hypothetical protein AAC03nite_36950 [Alicyclobacillus acidoterrestris]